MNIGLVFLIIVIVALAIGPVMMLRPSPQQKNKEHLRILARAKGIHFSMRNLPQQATDQEKSTPVPVYFFAPVDHQSTSNWMLLRTSYEHEAHFLGWWAWHDNIQANDAEQTVLKKYLPLLPDSVRAVSSGSNGVCVYWSEKGDERVLSLLIELLEALKFLQIKAV